jgi:DNA-binding beta-propeller fold protein YncE
VVNTYHLDTLSGGAITSCSPAGLALGASGNLMVGCANGSTQTVVLNPTANGGSGAIVRTIAAISGSDELWYDPVTGNFYVTGTNAGGHRVIDVISDATGVVLQSIDLTALGAGTVNAHSVAVDPLNGDIFVPLEGTTSAVTDDLCPSGCVAVFANVAGVPEPGSGLMMLVGLVVLLGAAAVRRGRRRDL